MQSGLVSWPSSTASRGPGPALQSSRGPSPCSYDPLQKLSPTGLSLRQNFLPVRRPLGLSIHPPGLLLPAAPPCAWKAALWQDWPCPRGGTGTGNPMEAGSREWRESAVTYFSPEPHPAFHVVPSHQVLPRIPNDTHLQVLPSFLKIGPLPLRSESKHFCLKRLSRFLHFEKHHRGPVHAFCRHKYNLNVSFQNFPSAFNISMKRSGGRRLPFNYFWPTCYESR